MSQTKYIRAKLPPVEGNAILLVKENKEVTPTMYVMNSSRHWQEIGGFWVLVPERWHKIDGKSVYWSLLRYE
jgi:hypothetical protein